MEVNSIGYLQGLVDRLDENDPEQKNLRTSFAAAILEILGLRTLLCEAIDLQPGQVPRKAPDAVHVWLYNHRVAKRASNLSSASNN